MKIPVITKKKKRVNLDYGDFALTVNCSGARTSAWHDKLTQCWLMLIRMSGWSASAETPHLILGSGKRPDIRAKIGDKEVLFDTPPYPQRISPCLLTGIGGITRTGFPR